MKAILCKELKGIQSLELTEIEVPSVTPDSLIVRIHATSLNFYDTLVVKGKYQYQPELPFSPGGEIAGIVEQVGENVKNFSIGDRVSSYVKWGGCAELIQLNAQQAIPIPDTVSFEAAAVVNVTYGTAMHAFCDRASLKPNETVAILGAAGGAGQAAIETAKLLGARVIACASTVEKLAITKECGADETINYDSENLKEQLKSLTNGEGVDVVYDLVGGEHAEAALRATRWRGKYLTVGYASGTIPKIPLNLLLLKGCDLLGIFWGLAIEREPEKTNANISQVFSWIAEGNLNPKIQHTFPLIETKTALNKISNREATGKIVIKPNK